MADWDDDDWERDDDIYDDRRRSSSGSKTVWIVLGLVGGGVLLMVVCAGLFIAGVVNQINNGKQGFMDDLFADSTPVEMPPVEVETPKEKQRAVTAAFGADDVGVDDATLQAIEKLFDELLAGCEDDDDEAMLATFDIDRLLLQTKKTGVIKARYRLSPCAPLCRGYYTALQASA